MIFFVEEKKEKLAEIKSGFDETDVLVFSFFLMRPSFYCSFLLKKHT